MIVSIIPARKGSKRIKNKNMQIVNGKPLIQHSIESSLHSKFIEKTIVTTDSKEIAELSEELGAQVIMRPDKLASDNAQTLDVVKHALETLTDIDTIVLLQPTCPNRGELLDEAIRKYHKSKKVNNDVDMLASVVKIDTPINWFLQIKNEKLDFAFDNDFSKVRKQDLESYYKLNGSIFIYDADLINCSDKYAWGRNVIPFEMDSKHSFDIDEPEDLEFANFIMRKQMSKVLQFGNFSIGDYKPVFIIAEAGVNHNGDLDLAKKLIDVAAEAKVDAVKFQTFTAERLVTKNADQAEYQKKNIGKSESQFDMLKRLELKKEHHPILKSYAEKKGLIFLSTPFDEEAIDFLDELGIVGFKAGSGEVSNIPYLEKMACKNKPIILSLGMSTIEEVYDAVNAIKSKQNNNLILLHCTTNYPNPYEDVNMRTMQTIRQKTNCLVGYSDHTEGIIVPIVAVANGACVIEKHYTLDKNMQGPDHKASLEPNELKEMVKQIRLVESILGNSEKKPTQAEEKISVVAKKSIVARVDIKKGESIKREMVEIKRPGTGIKPKKLKMILGKKAMNDIKADSLLKWSDLE